MVPSVVPLVPGVVDCVVDGAVVEGIVEGEVVPEPMPEAGGVIGAVEGVPGEVGVVVEGPEPLGCANAMPLARTSTSPQAVEVVVRMKEWDMLAPGVNECSTSVAPTEDSLSG
ncbi:hypothetical protein [Hydrogenophaga sp.]|jgi:hypothetical protein|uniref:hypothetical protein n=1 Tax=Hydrogenophaga sp. TaxID=1904254 RepID=UPI003F6EF86A